MKEITVISCSNVYKFTGVLLGKDITTQMYKTAEGKYLVFEKERNGDEGMFVFPTDQALLNSGGSMGGSDELQWIEWAGLEFPESMVKRL